MEDRFNTRDSQSNINQLIVSTPFFAGLPDPVIERATVHIVTRSHPSNQVILLENDWGTSVYFILDGWVKIRTYNLDGKEVTLNILGKGELFGEMAAIEEAPRSTDVISDTDRQYAVSGFRTVNSHRTPGRNSARSTHGPPPATSKSPAPLAGV
jgi:CRP/FNR family transcriptional regulator, cyclic AMP receptor protein